MNKGIMLENCLFLNEGIFTNRKEKEMLTKAYIDTVAFLKTFHKGWYLQVVETPKKVSKYHTFISISGYKDNIIIKKSEAVRLSSKLKTLENKLSKYPIRVIAEFTGMNNYDEEYDKSKKDLFDGLIVRISVASEFSFKIKYVDSY